MFRACAASLMRAAVVVLVAVTFTSLAATVSAAQSSQSSSSNYMINESQFGTGSSLNDCSENYCANSSSGDTTVGRTASDRYRAMTGGNTTGEPLLEVVTLGGLASLGALSPDKTSTLTMNVSVRSYMTGGYSMQISGPPPSYGSHELSRLAEPTESQVGVEQFGINLVANNVPQVGSNPEQVPSNQTSFGEVASNYKIADRFMYEDGDIVAFSRTDSGRTDYTIAMILNISNVTPGGWYTSMFSAVVAPAF